jgi:hypothetical protein
MPRVHQMRTDLAQFYHSRKSSFRLQSLVSPDERQFFELNGTDLLLRDLNVFCETNANHRSIMEKIQSIAINNNTTGASIYELGQLMSPMSLGSLNSKLKELDDKAQARAEMQAQREQELKQKELDAKKTELQMQQDFKAKEAEKERRKDLLVAEIRAAGYGAMQDVNENKQSDYLDALEELKSSEEYQATMNVQRAADANKTQIANKKLDIEKEKLQVMKEDSMNKLKIAKENQTASEIKAKKGKK